MMLKLFDSTHVSSTVKLTLQSNNQW